LAEDRNMPTRDDILIKILDNVRELLAKNKRLQRADAKKVLMTGALESANDFRGRDVVVTYVIATYVIATYVIAIELVSSYAVATT
jgi:hypothetical protein